MREESMGITVYNFHTDSLEERAERSRRVELATNAAKVLSLVVPAGLAFRAAAAVAIGAHSVYTRMTRQDGGVDLVELDKKGIVEKDLRFPPGHLVSSGVYCTSPVDSKMLWPLAHWHRHCLEARAAAFSEMCRNLGVREMRLCILYEASNSGSGRAQAAADVPEFGQAEVKGSMDYRKGWSIALERSSSFLPSGKAPSATQSPWKAFDSGWRELESARLDSNVQRYTYKNQFTADFGINAELVGSLRGMSLNIAGEVATGQKELWECELTF